MIKTDHKLIKQNLLKRTFSYQRCPSREKKPPILLGANAGGT